MQRDARLNVFLRREMERSGRKRLDETDDRCAEYEYKKTTKSHKQMVAEWKKVPEFVAAYDELETETLELRKGLQSRQRSGLTQFFRQSPLHDVEINLDRSVDEGRPSGCPSCFSDSANVYSR